ncbi:MAG: hypothetical protein RMJ19_03610 [Gemmatales bacterium]|nr:hypothetical protein [Gemmatales bacterium]MDW8174733.1 hypothetical protein [Gemmatales bacterium]
MAAEVLTGTRLRKLVYTGLILVLFVAMLVHRREVVERKAEQHSLTETNLAQVDLGGSAARFVLTSFRGPLVCVLWWESRELFRRKEWSRLELILRALTKLQPHFRGPWEFMGWDLAYNVAVEFDAAEDKYHYVAKGTNWLAEGERTLRRVVYDPEARARREVGNPDLRWYIGNVVHHKITYSDEAPIFRCFFHLSCIPPELWDPDMLRQNPERLREFKRTYPVLTEYLRRFRHVAEGAENALDEALVTFCRQYRGIVGRYRVLAGGQASSLKQPAEMPFPIWPGELDLPPRYHPDTHLESQQEPHEILYHWSVFAQEPLPPFDPENPYQSETSRLYQGTKKSPYFFRAHPARAKGMKARFLGKEGWPEEAQQAWAESYQEWVAFGRLVGFLRDDMERLRELASELAKRYPSYVQSATLPPEAYRNPQIQEMIRAHQLLQTLNHNRAPFDSWMVLSVNGQTEKSKEARRLAFVADRKLAGRTPLAVETFHRSFDLWRDLLTQPFHPQRDATVLFGLHSETHGFPLWAVLWRELLGNSYSEVSATRHGAFALSLGSAAAFPWSAAFPVALSIQEITPYLRTPYGRNDQVQREIVDMELNYMRLWAELEAPHWLPAGTGLHLLTHWGLGLANPTSSFASVCLPRPGQLSLENWENLLQRMPAPLDVYLPKGARESAEQNLFRGGIGGQRRLILPEEIQPLPPLLESKPSALQEIKPDAPTKP